MAGEAYVRRWPTWHNTPTQDTPIDSQYLQGVEDALLRLLGADPLDKGAQVWDVALARMKSVLIKNENIDSAAAIAKSKLGALSIVDADVAVGANIDAGKISGLSGVGVPAGVVAPFAGAAAPGGWLLCDGSAVSRVTYSSLFTAIGTGYGAGDGSTTFNLPDMQGRAPVGKGTHADVTALGSSDGLAVANRRPKHKHTVSNDSPDHSHPTTISLAINSGGAVAVQAFQGDDSGRGTPVFSSGGASARHSHTVGPQTGAEPTDSAAYLVLNYIIKT